MLAGQVARIGDVLEASPSDARFLIGIGKAVEAIAVVADVVQDLPEPTRKPTTPRRRAKS
jgi:hypothetical protein